MGRIRLRFGDNEIEVEGSDSFIRKYLEQFYKRLGVVPSVTGKAALKEQLLLPAASLRAAAKTLTPAEFYKQKGKTDGVAQVLVFGKYLEQFRNQAEFTRKNINMVAKEAKIAKDIHAQYFTNAVKQGLLRKQGQKYSLTLSAEELLAGT